jgi:serine/threonine protein kinase
VIGKSISHFRILAKLGEGGMGVVYKAEDERLSRPVALKILRSDARGGEEWRLRLIREARTAASVNHPNIAAIYEVDEADGETFIAMEYVEGSSLRALLRGRPLAIKEALRIGTGMAEGCARAHQARIIHRDLKPENVAIALDGQVKILDFGLARLVEQPAEATPSELSRLETISADQTLERRIVGTAAYMSPEQARGQSLDARSDLFSFGIVLYEMVTGRAPFKGSTTMDTLTAIIREAPAPAMDLNPEAPAELQRILDKCLEKDPSDRYQDARDLVVDLRRLMRDTDSHPMRRQEVSAPRVARASRHRAARLMVPLALAALAAIAVSGWNAWQRRGEVTIPAPEREVRQRQLTANPAENSVNSPAISPDGKFLAYSDKTGLYLLSIDSGETRTLPISSLDTKDIWEIRWFPDGTRLVFVTWATSKGAIWSYSIMSGAARKLREDVDDPSVSPDGALIAFSASDYREIWVMEANGERQRRILVADKGGKLSRPVWAPEGRRIVYQAFRRNEKGTIETALETADTQGGARSVVLPLPASAWDFESWYCWLRDGRIIYSRPGADPLAHETTLWEIPVNASSGQPEGAPRRIVVSAGFTLDRLSSSTDGKRLAFLRGAWQADVHVGELEREGRGLKPPKRLTLDDRQDELGGWTRDGQAIFFSSNRNGTNDVFKQDLSSNAAELVLGGPDDETYGSLTPDGASLLFWQIPVGQAGTGVPPHLMRFPLSGGAPELVFDPATDAREDVSYGVACVKTACVLSETIEHKQLVFFALDPERGPGRELARIEVIGTGVHWDLSPDGRTVAIQEKTARLRVVSLSDGSVRDLQARNLGTAISIGWSWDGQRLFVNSEHVLSSVNFEGEAVALWHTRDWISSPRPSPEGRHLALQAESSGANAWLIENF